MQKMQSKGGGRWKGFENHKIENVNNPGSYENIIILMKRKARVTRECKLSQILKSGFSKITLLITLHTHSEIPHNPTSEVKCPNPLKYQDALISNTLK